MRRGVLSAFSLAAGLWVSGTPTQAQTLSISDVRQLEGNGGPGATTFTFTVTLSASAGVVQADWATANGTAVAGPLPTGDFVSASGTVVFPAGDNTPQTVLVAVHGDAAAD